MRLKHAGIAALAVALALAVSWLTVLYHAAAAQQPLTNVTRGVLLEARCAETACMTRVVVVRTATGVQRFLASAAATVVYVGNQQAPLPLAVLERVIGTGVLVTSQPLDAGQVAGRIDVLVFSTQFSIDDRDGRLGSGGHGHGDGGDR